MKKLKYILIIISLFFLSCEKYDINPIQKHDEHEIQMKDNTLVKISLSSWGDDFVYMRVKNRFGDWKSFKTEKCIILYWIYDSNDTICLEHYNGDTKGVLKIIKEDTLKIYTKPNCAGSINHPLVNI